jgi:hypothetical protein
MYVMVLRTLSESVSLAKLRAVLALLVLLTLRSQRKGISVDNWIQIGDNESFTLLSSTGLLKLRL